MTVPAIVDRQTLKTTVESAWASVREMRDSQLTSSGVFAQLDAIRGWLSSPHLAPRSPAPEATLAPFAVRHLDPASSLAQRLKAIDYALRRFDALPHEPSLIGPGRTARRGIFQVVYGRDAFSKIAIVAGDRAMVGRAPRAGLAVRDDQLQPEHFELWWDGVVAHLRTLTRHRVTLAGEDVWMAELRNGDVLHAGSSVFRFHVEAATAPRKVSAPRADVKEMQVLLADALKAGSLYGVLDGARDDRIRTLLTEAVDASWSLYEGEVARELDRVAPMLVRFDADSGLITRLLHEGWGRAWGIFIVSSGSREGLRRSLRRLLMVEAEGHRAPMYFRFYDPRVLRDLAPVLTVRQRSEMLRASDCWWFEREDTGAEPLKRDGGA